MKTLKKRNIKGLQDFRVLIFAISLFLFSTNLPAQILQPEHFHGQVDKTVSRLLSKFHYSHLELNDSLSSEIFDRYLDRLDPNKNYFLASQIARFEKYRNQMDEIVLSGQLNPAYEIFNLFKKQVNLRLDKVPQQLKKKFDFTIAEELTFENDDETWAKNEEELDEKWRKRLKNQALNLKLAGKDKQGIEDILTKRYQNIQRRINQYDSEEVFELFMNAYSQSLDPHTNYFSPITSENFGIRMSLSFEGIGARLTTENEYTKIVEIVPGGPADLDKRLKPNDYIIGVDEHNDGKVIDVIGWKLDDVVQRIRGKKGSNVRLQILPSGDVEGGES
ncbi:MAG: PDZ domain-containing protein, partial [bacterium]